MTTPHKICPRCHRPADLHAPVCQGCGRQYRTQFPQGPDQTVLGQSQVPTGQPYQPPAGYPYQQPPAAPGYPPPPPPPAGVAEKLIQLEPGTQMPWLAVVFGLLLPGGGQLYNRQFIKGALIFLVSSFLASAAWFFVVVTLGYGLLLLLLLGPVAFVVSLVPCIDGYKVAVRLQRGDAVRQWQWF